MKSSFADLQEGGIVYTVVFQQLVPALGFAWTNRVMGFISLATFIIATAALVKAQDESKVGNHRRARSLFDRTALKDVSFLLFTMAQFLVFLAYLVPLFFIPTFAQTALGTSRSFAIWLLVIAQGTSLVGRVLGGFVAQWTGTMLSWTVCCAVSAILCLIWVAVQDLAGFIVFSALYGKYCHLVPPWDSRPTPLTTARACYWCPHRPSTHHLPSLHIYRPSWYSHGNVVGGNRDRLSDWQPYRIGVDRFAEEELLGGASLERRCLCSRYTWPRCSMVEAPERAFCIKLNPLHLEKSEAFVEALGSRQETCALL